MPGTIGKPIRKMTDLGRAVLLDMDQLATPAPTPTPMMQVPNPTEVGLINALRSLLASSYGMYILAHAAHWNVEGREFASLHDYFGDLYEDVFGAIDPFAEAIRQHGGYAPTSFADTLNANTAMPAMPTGGEAVPMIAGLMNANTDVMASLRAAKTAATAAADDGLANFCDERLAAHLKHDWQLKSLAK